MYVKNDTRFKYKNIQKVTLTAGVESVINVSSGSYVLVQNVGIGNCNIAFDEVANTTKWQLNDGDVFPVIMKCSSIHAYSASATPTIQVMELDIS